MLKIREAKQPATEEFFNFYQSSDHQRSNIVLKLSLQTSSSDCSCLLQTADCTEFLSPPAKYSSFRQVMSLLSPPP